MLRDVTYKALSCIKPFNNTALNEQQHIMGDKKSLQERFIDSHCHAHDNPKSIQQLKYIKAAKVYLMGTSPKDWVVLKNITPSEKVRVGFGIHPWHARGVLTNKPLTETTVCCSNDTIEDNKEPTSTPNAITSTSSTTTTSAPDTPCPPSNNNNTNNTENTTAKSENTPIISTTTVPNTDDINEDTAGFGSISLDDDLEGTAPTTSSKPTPEAPQPAAKVKVKQPKQAKPKASMQPQYTPISPNDNETLALLKKTLIEVPTAFVGEIGVDRIITRRTGGNPCPLDEQWALFDAQINIATELGRPVSVHCVDVFGGMFEYFQARTDIPPTIALHSFGGSSDVVARYLKLPNFGSRFYFGFSYAINSRSQRLSETISKTPLDRILLESDLPHHNGIDGDLYEMCKIVAKAHEVQLSVVAEQTRKNALEFMCI